MSRFLLIASRSIVHTQRAQRSKNLRSALLGFGHQPIYSKSILHTHGRQEVDPLDVDTAVLIDQLPKCLCSSLGHGVLTLILSFKSFESKAPSIEVEQDSGIYQALLSEVYLLCLVVGSSVWKSGLKTVKRPRLNR